jgi:hypothetical protein
MPSALKLSLDQFLEGSPFRDDAAEIVDGLLMTWIEPLTDALEPVRNCAAVLRSQVPPSEGICV